MQTNLITIMCINFWTDPIYNPIQIAQATGAITTALAFLYVVKQSKTSKVQQFENTLFNLIYLQNDILSGISKGEHHGRQVFSLAVAIVQQVLDGELFTSDDGAGGTIVRKEAIVNLEHAKNIFRSQYIENYYKDFEDAFSHYFRNLYHILKYIHQSTLINDRLKHFYASLVRAQLSQNQLHVWMFNAMWPEHGNPNALYLIKKYNMFKNFNEDTVTPAVWWEYFEELTKNVRTPGPFKRVNWWERTF